MNPELSRKLGRILEKRAASSVEVRESRVTRSDAEDKILATGHPPAGTSRDCLRDPPKIGAVEREHIDPVSPGSEQSSFWNHAHKGRIANFTQRRDDARASARFRRDDPSGNLHRAGRGERRNGGDGIPRPIQHYGPDGVTRVHKDRRVPRRDADLRRGSWLDRIEGLRRQTNRSDFYRDCRFAGDVAHSNANLAPAAGIGLYTESRLIKPL